MTTTQAVPLDLIQLKPSSFSGPAVPRNSGFHIRSARFGSERHSNDAAIGPPSSSQDASPLVYPIFFNQIGRYSGPVTYYVDTPAVRQEWEKKFKEAIALGQRTQEKNRVVRLEVLSDQTFGATTAIGSLTPEAPASTQFGRPTCSVPLTTTDGQSTVSLIVAGCAEGLFIGFRGKPRSMKQVVHLAGITQCAVLQEFGFILVVASKVLIACTCFRLKRPQLPVADYHRNIDSLEALVPSGKKSEPTSKVPQRLSGQKDVLFFRVGKVGDIDPRTLVICESLDVGSFCFGAQHQRRRQAKRRQGVGLQGTRTGRQRRSKSRRRRSPTVQFRPEQARLVPHLQRYAGTVLREANAELTKLFAIRLLHSVDGAFLMARCSLQGLTSLSRRCSRSSFFAASWPSSAREESK